MKDECDNVASYCLGARNEKDSQDKDNGSSFHQYEYDYVVLSDHYIVINYVMSVNERDPLFFFKEYNNLYKMNPK